jgi:hypothetical protein
VASVKWLRSDVQHLLEEMQCQTGRRYSQTSVKPNRPLQCIYVKLENPSGFGILAYEDVLYIVIPKT